MTTSIIVEDGTTVEGANSYVSTADAIAYAALRGVTIPNVSDSADAYIYKTMDIIETKSYKGCKTVSTQRLQFARSGVCIDGVLLPNDEIPFQLINAQCELFIAIYQGYDPFAIVTKEDMVKRKKFDIFEKEYFDGASISPMVTRFETWITPLLESGSDSIIQFQCERGY